MELTLGGVAAVAFASALGLMYKKYAKKAVPWLMIVASIGLSGVLGVLVTKLVTSLVNGMDTVSGRIFGAAGVGGIVVLAWMSIVLYPHLKPKGQPPTKFTPWVAFAYSPVLVTVGGIFSSLAGLSENIVTQAASFLMENAAAFIAGF